MGANYARRPEHLDPDCAFGIDRPVRYRAAKAVTYEQCLRAVDEGHTWASPSLAVDLWENLPDDDRLAFT